MNGSILPFMDQVDLRFAPMHWPTLHLFMESATTAMKTGRHGEHALLLITYADLLPIKTDPSWWLLQTEAQYR